MKTTTAKPYEINFNEIVRETAKAICFNFTVRFSGNESRRDIWMPKSVVLEYTDTTATIAAWFINKTMEESAFNGYKMYFAGIVNE